MRPSSSDPLIVTVERGGARESQHRVHALVMDETGAVVRSWGDPGLEFFPRSSVKLIQALPLALEVLRGQAKLSEKELALACSSHHAESFHVSTVSAWLSGLGFREADLECGAHDPNSKQATKDLYRSGATCNQLHNNCSGKHTGLLHYAKLKGFTPRGYSEHAHPVQKALRERLAQFFGRDFSAAPWGVDGCGIPTYRIALRELAQGMARIAAPKYLGSEIQEAVKLLNSAIAAEPLYLGGTESFCSKVIAAHQGRVFAKTGAEGVYGIWVPEQGIGAAIKCEDGATRASEAAATAVLSELGFQVPWDSRVQRWTGDVVGRIHCE